MDPSRQETIPMDSPKQLEQSEVPVQKLEAATKTDPKQSASDISVEPINPDNKDEKHDESHGLQMLKITEDHKYILNEIGLKNLLLREDVKDLPVAVVAVAGAYRMGKSFLLDYFLRYLEAPREKQENGEWLGDPDAPLTGFSWRGGSERHTTGMVMWSGPIFATLSTGQKALVILFDTQGTFDSESTVRDNSTVFALSTLLSSVLIYNIKENIKEDDLQHLQLFTKYGELVKTKNQKAFQTLEFLVRDYPFPFEHPYGQTGGEQLLNLRLQIASRMPEEKRQLREHIRSAYDTVTAYLLPHPGFGVVAPDYKGSHGVLKPEFKEHLKQLVESLFSPDKLTLKKITGEPVKAQDLLTYIKTYINIFDSDTLPKPMDIVKATTEAGLLLAAREARELYQAEMEKECGQNQPSMPVRQINEYHARSSFDALQGFLNKKKMGSNKDIEPHLAKLKQDLEAKLRDYLVLNHGKLQKAIADGHAEFEKEVQRVTQGKPICLHTVKLDELIKTATTAARQMFDFGRRQIPYITDEERIRFLQEIDDRSDDLKQENIRNNKLHFTESLLSYNNAMNSLLIKDPPLDEYNFETRHQQEMEKAINDFQAHRNIASNEPDDDFLSKLSERIEQHFTSIKRLNQNKHRKAMQAALNFYDNAMNMFWDPEENCLHPSDLKIEHNKFKKQAMSIFSDESSGSTDLDSLLLEQSIELRYQDLKELNNEGNELAVASGYRKYKSIMNEKCSPDAWWLLLIVPIIVYAAKKWSYHTEAREAALRDFYSHRKDLMNSNYDRYKEKLLEKIDDAYRTY